MLLAGAGCGTAGEEESPGAVEQAMKSATSIKSARGVVWLRRLVSTDAQGRPVDRECTGSMINPNVIVTAGHCVGDTSWSKFTIDYFDPAVDKRRRITEDWEPLSTERLPDYELIDGVANPEHDLAIVVRNVPWQGTSSDDYLYIRNSTAVSTPLDVTIYGAGYDTFSRTGLGDLEKYTKAADRVTERTIVTSDPSRKGRGRVCQGDSGGPVNLAYNDGETWVELPIALAVNSVAEQEHKDDACQAKYGKAIHTRIGPNIAWIERRSAGLLGVPGPHRCSTVLFQTAPFAPLVGAYRCWN